MANDGNWKDFAITPLSGLLDLRSPAGTLGINNFRIVLNFCLSEEKKLCRLGGLKKLFSDSPFGFSNQDLHDQVLPCLTYFEGFSQVFSFDGGYMVPPNEYTYIDPYSYTYDYCGTLEYLRQSCRQPITLLAQAQLEDSGRKLIAATRDKIFALNEASANWEILADGLGGFYVEEDCEECSSRRFSMVRLGGWHLFTNGFDPVLAWQFDAPIYGCNQWRAQYVQELLALGITKVKVLGSWNGFVFAANVEEAGETFTSKIFWSDFNAPLSWIPSDTSLANFTDLGFGQEILRIEPLGSQLRIYTATHIFEGLLVGGDEQFRFLKIYGSQTGDDTLKYRYSLINTGKTHLYLASTGIMQLGEYDRAPQQIEWMHKADGAIFTGVTATDVIGFPDLPPFGPINESFCDMAVGWWDSERKLCWWSWPTDDNTCPNMSLILSPQYGFSSLVDKGFLCGLSYTPDPRQSLLDWLRLNQICNPSEFISEIKKMGLPLNFADDVFTDPPLYFWNETEDWDLPMGPNSLCERLGATSVEDLCGFDCKTVTLVLSDASDFTLKEYDPDVFYREQFVEEENNLYCPYTSVGSYTQQGYTSMWQGDAFKYGKNEEKSINLLSVDAVARQQATPGLLECQVAYGAQAGCLTWVAATPRELRCLTEFSAAQHLANNTRPDTFLRYPVYRTGQFLAYRFAIRGTGGGSCFSEVKLHVRLKQSCW